MKNLIKKSVLSVLIFALVLACIPVSAEAKTKYKWVKKATLSGKDYKTSDGDGSYVACIWSDRTTEMTITCGSGFVPACNDGGADGLHTYRHEGDKYTSKGYKNAVDAFHTTYYTTAYYKKGDTYNMELKRGFNCVVLSPLYNVKLKSGDVYKCKINFNDANVIILNCKRDEYNGVVKNTFISEKEYVKFMKWVGPYDETFCEWESRKTFVTEEIAWFMIKSNLTEYKPEDDTNENVEKLAKEIQEYVEKKVEKAKRSGKFMDYRTVLDGYIAKQNGFKEAVEVWTQGDWHNWDDLMDSVQMIKRVKE